MGMTQYRKTFSLFQAYVFTYVFDNGEVNHCGEDAGEIMLAIVLPQ